MTNSEGYRDYTAEDAIGNIQQRQVRAELKKDALEALKKLQHEASVLGWRIQGSFQLKQLSSGKRIEFINWK